MASSLRPNPSAATPLAPLAPALAASGPILDPSTTLDTRFSPIRLLPRDDEVLRHLVTTGFRDEREFVRMILSEPRIATPIRSMDTLVGSFGYRIDYPQGGETPARKLLKQHAEQMMKRLERFPDADERASRAVYMGWQPFQVVYGEVSRFRGRPVWWPTQLVDQKQHNFSFTPEWDLVLHGNGYQKPEGFSGPWPLVAPKDSPEWIVARSGSSATPYATAELSGLWLGWDLKQRFFKYFALGARDAIKGIMKIRETGPPVDFGKGLLAGSIDSGEGVGVLDTLIQAAKDLVRRWERDGIAICRAGLDLELLANVNFADGWRKAFEYLDMLFQLSIEYQHLTSEQPAATGSYASAKTHMQTKMAGGQRLAWKKRAVWQRDYIERTLDMNEPNIDPEDYPLFSYGINTLVNLADVALMVNMGFEAAAEPIADQVGISRAAPDAEPGTVLRRREAPAVAPTQQPSPPKGKREADEPPDPSETEEPEV